jgi:hypothetical protein
MSADAKKHYGLSLVLLALGVLALYGGAHWLVLVIPAAALVWFVGAPKLRRGRN